MEVLLHLAGKRRFAAVRGSMARPQPIAERRSALVRPRSTAARHFTAAVGRMAAARMAAARMAAGKAATTAKMPDYGDSLEDGTC
jgi:hypothetical protein